MIVKLNDIYKDLMNYYNEVNYYDKDLDFYKAYESIENTIDIIEKIIHKNKTI